MVPELTTCDQCGRTVIVMSWAPVYVDEWWGADQNQTHNVTEISCKIDCPQCGTRVQVVKVAAIEQ